MSQFSQIPFGLADFANNPEPRCPVLLLLDSSGSMYGEKIRQLNEGLNTFKEDLNADHLAAKRCEIAVISFGPVQEISDFVSVDAFFPPPLEAYGDTPLGAAITQGLDMLHRRKETIRQNGVGLYRPWVFLITDGTPTDEWQAAAALIREGEQKKSFAFFSVGVEGANFEVLQQLGPREPLRLSGLRFKELFLWLSNSLKSVSQSSPGDKVALKSPKGWAEI